MANTPTIKEKLDSLGLWVLAGLGALWLLNLIFGFNFSAGISFGQ